MKTDTLAFLQKDYELKIRYLSDHYSRMWNRCNFFVGIETALSVALFGWFKDRGGFSSEATFITIVGAISSLCWYIFGAQDRYLAEVYRKQVKVLGEKIGSILDLSNELGPEYAQYTYVGDTETEKAKVRRNPYQWRFDLISTTKLAAWFPFLVLIYWIVMIVLTARR